MRINVEHMNKNLVTKPQQVLQHAIELQDNNQWVVSVTILLIASISLYSTCQSLHVACNKTICWCQAMDVQQIMAHMSSIRKDMIILEKSEFSQLKYESEVLTYNFLPCFAVLIMYFIVMNQVWRLLRSFFLSNVCRSTARKLPSCAQS